jgi:hypothetical protein
MLLHDVTFQSDTEMVGCHKPAIQPHALQKGEKEVKKSGRS